MTLYDIKQYNIIKYPKGNTVKYKDKIVEYYVERCNVM